MEKHTRCPMCDSLDIEYVTEDLDKSYHGVPFVAKGIETLKCHNCGDGFYSYEMIKRIESFRPEVPQEVQR